MSTATTTSTTRRALSSSSSSSSYYYVSITGLEIKSLWYVPVFWYYAIPSMMQAKSAPGNVSAEAFARNGMQHTVSVWTDRASMLQYLRQGAHLQAMKMNRTVSSYTKVYGYVTDVIPTDQDDIVELWETHGRVVLGNES